MILVTVELHPFGDASRRTTLGQVAIWNDGSARNRGDGLYQWGNYVVEERHPDGMRRNQRHAIRKFARRAGWLPLVFLAFEAIAHNWKVSRRRSFYFPWNDSKETQ